MIGLDTNILVRYFVQDDPVQAAAAARFLETELTLANRGFVSIVVAAEISWVLERAYRFTHLAIAGAFEALLATDVIVVESKAEVFRAMIALKTDRASFADALIGELGMRAGCAYTATFDRKAARTAQFRLLPTT